MNLRSRAKVMVVKLLNSGLRGWLKGRINNFKSKSWVTSCLWTGVIFKIFNRWFRNWHSGNHWKPPGVPGTYTTYWEVRWPGGAGKGARAKGTGALSRLGPLTLYQLIWKHFGILNAQYGCTSEVLGVGGGQCGWCEQQLNRLGQTGV